MSPGVPTRGGLEEFPSDVLGNKALAGDHGRRGFFKRVEVQPGVWGVEVEVQKLYTV